MAEPVTQNLFSNVEDKLKYQFCDPKLLLDALTHPSRGQEKRTNKQRQQKNRKPFASPYERLEFLGDRVLGLAIADMLYQKFPAEAEGDLAMRYTSLVSQEPLAEVAVELALDEAILLNKGTAKDNGRANASILSDTCEAVIGAIYLDSGFDAAKRLIERVWAKRILKAPKPPKDSKNALQEWAQGRGLPLPKYKVLSQSGPSHAPVFNIQVEVVGNGTETATGASKRTAEQTAASALIERLTKKDS